MASRVLRFVKRNCADPAPPVRLFSASTIDVGVAAPGERAPFLDETVERPTVCCGVSGADLRRGAVAIGELAGRVLFDGAGSLQGVMGAEIGDAEAAGRDHRLDGVAPLEPRPRRQGHKAMRCRRAFRLGRTAVRVIPLPGVGHAAISLISLVMLWAEKAGGKSYSARIRVDPAPSSSWRLCPWIVSVVLQCDVEEGHRTIDPSRCLLRYAVSVTLGATGLVSAPPLRIMTDVQNVPANNPARPVPIACGYDPANTHPPLGAAVECRWHDLSGRLGEKMAGWSGVMGRFLAIRPTGHPLSRCHCCAVAELAASFRRWLRTVAACPGVPLAFRGSKLRNGDRAKSLILWWAQQDSNLRPAD